MKNKTYYEVGKRIRLLREKRCYSREKLSELAGISSKFLYEIENGNKGLSADTLCRITKALSTESDYLLFGEYRGNMESEIQRILCLFSGTRRETVLEILKLMLSLID